MPIDIWELAKQQVKEQTKRKAEQRLQQSDNVDGTETEEHKQSEENDAHKPDQRHVVLCGSKDSGKTSLILRFLDRDEIPKPTVALEYTYGRRSRANTKEVAHIWELGGGTQLTSLLHIPIKAATLDCTSVVIVIDLSEPSHLWTTLTQTCNTIRQLTDEAHAQLKRTNAKLAAHVDATAWTRWGDNEQEKNLAKPFKVPVAIVGSKYDLFQNFDSEQKKLICKTLRFVAHLHGASLHFFSTKIETLVSRGRALLSHCAFDTTASKALAVDHQKPIFVPHGSDSFKEIGTPPLADQALASIHANNPMELWQAAFTGMFPQTETTSISKDDPAKDPQYREERIDQIRSQKDQELERYLRQQRTLTQQGRDRKTHKHDQDNSESEADNSQQN